jgi:ATP-dependent DNA helicase RecQ
MPAAPWSIYRLGAKLPSVDSLLDPTGSDDLAKLQQALSSVACIEASLPLGDASPATDDAWFVGRLLLGLVCRGWPAFSSPAVERALLASINPESGLVYRESGPEGTIGWRLDSARPVPGGVWSDAIRGALLRGDRRLDVDEAMLGLLCDSTEERTFYRDHLTPLLGNAIGWLELQRPIASMVREDPPNPDVFGSGRVDFALDLPGPGRDVRLVIELDGPHHKEPMHRVIDQRRDDLLRIHEWETRRVPVATVDDGSLNYLPGALRAIVEGNPFPFTHIEDADHALADPRNKEATRLLLSPHAIARVQSALCRGLMTGALQLGATEWVVAVVERDTPCAELAVCDWLTTLRHLCHLYDIELGLQRIRVLVAEDHRGTFPPAQWAEVAASDIDVLRERLATDGDVGLVDLAVDVSVGCHPTRRYPADPLRNVRSRLKVKLRTAQRQSGYMVEPWPEPRPVANPRAHEESLTYFLQTLFRKHSFRKGQLEIVERCIRRQDVIGLLPTGAGKSITFQLPALLSPGLTLVIDPIKSLMQDQAENLHATGIMDAIQINSDTPAEDRKGREWQFGQGEFRLVFISPERLLIQAFRELLLASAGKRPIAYVVIDEAHCVSEWGHDFRTAYLNLGRIATDYCGRNGMRPPLAALTGTASEPVLRDIQRELAVEGNDAIVRPAKFDRDELKFAIVPVPRDKKLGELARLVGEVIPERLGVEPDVLASGACGGIVFCPHKGGALGVFGVATKLSRWLPHFAFGDQRDQCPDSGPVSYYSGEPPKHLQIASKEYGACKARVQRAFKDGRISLLVATKAFGMGIDKPNIRYTIHYAMAQSVEAFAQEAGRAGRDRKDAICAVLFTDRHGTESGTPSAAVDCLEVGISTEEARDRVAAAGWHADDAEVQMFLHTRSYQGIRRESAAVRALYHHWIEPALPVERDTSAHVAEIVIGELEYKAVIEDLMAPMMERDSVDEAILHEKNGKSEKSPRPELQRLIYRLSLLGVVSDYTVVYSPIGDVYRLSVCAIRSEDVRDHLLQYVRRYRTSERIAAVEQRLADSTLKDPVCRCIDTLCWFIYEEIEQRRRQGMANMRQMLRDSVDGEDLARRINEMLSFTALTETVFRVLDAGDYRDWAMIGSEITNAESAELVYYQCQRALEDAPLHPGLLLLVGLARQAMTVAGREEVERYILAGLREIQAPFSQGDQREIAAWTIHELVRIAPSAAPRILDQIVKRSPDALLAGTILRSMDEGTLESDPVLRRTCQRRLLHRIDEHVGAFMTA